jgi:hypothetical protein
MLHFGIGRPDERGLITNPLGLAAVRLTLSLPRGYPEYPEHDSGIRHATVRCHETIRDKSLHDKEPRRKARPLSGQYLAG